MSASAAGSWRWVSSVTQQTGVRGGGRLGAAERRQGQKPARWAAGDERRQAGTPLKGGHDLLEDRGVLCTRGWGREGVTSVRTQSQSAGPTEPSGSSSGRRPVGENSVCERTARKGGR